MSKAWSLGSTNKPERERDSSQGIEGVPALRRHVVDASLIHAYDTVAPGHGEMVDAAQRVALSRRELGSNVVSIQEYALRKATQPEETVAPSYEEALDAWAKDDNVASARAQLRAVQSQAQQQSRESYYDAAS